MIDASDLISPKEALEILPFVSYAGLYAGCKGTNVLTRHQAGSRTLYSRTECEKLRDRVLNGKQQRSQRPCPTELV